MWKTIYSIDLNLLIGIIGGIISGIFVSYVFLIESEFRNQFNHVKEMFTSIYGITATYSAYEHFKITKGKKRANKVKAIDNAGNIAGKSNIVDILNNYWNELSSFFITYDLCFCFLSDSISAQHINCIATFLTFFITFMHIISLLYCAYGRCIS